MRVAFSIISALVLIAVLYFVIVGVVHIGWGIGAFLLAVIVLCGFFEVIEDMSLIGCAVLIVVVLVICQIFIF